MSKRFGWLAVSLIAALLLSSCLTLSDSISMLVSKALAQGLLEESQAEILKSAVTEAVFASRELSPEEEYYLGRAISGAILEAYQPCDCPELTAYINKLGQGLALFSPRPELFKGYHFLILNSDEPNAFAMPGGQILITRGLLSLTENEDELAAILSHEISHVALRHGVLSLQSYALTELAREAAIKAGQAGSAEAVSFTNKFGTAISELAAVLLVSGYSQNFEYEADRTAQRMIAQLGYAPSAVATVIGKLPDKEGEGANSYAITHPEKESRIGALESSVSNLVLFPFSGGARWRKFAMLLQETEPDENLPVPPLGVIRADRYARYSRFFKKDADK